MIPFDEYIVYKCEGYHGTTITSAKNILKNKMFLPSESDFELLGTGIYFFEYDIQQAVYWCKVAQRYPEWTVLKCDLEFKKLLDLTNRKYFDLFVKYFEKSIVTIKKYVEKDLPNLIDTAKSLRIMKKLSTEEIERQLLLGYFIDLLAEKGEIDGVKAFVEFDPSKRIGNIILTQVQICVKNHNCIKSIKEVNINAKKSNI